MKQTSIAAMSILIATAAATAADTYPIRLSAPSHVGDAGVFSSVVTRKFSQTWTNPGTTRRPVHEEYTAKLEATETVDAVTAKGRPQRVTIKVSRCTKDGKDLLPPGTSIMAESVNGKTEFKVGGVAAADEVRKVLSQLIYTARPDEPTADDEYGTDRPRKIGEVWPANADQLALATRLPYRVNAEDLTGEAKLVDVSLVNGQRLKTVSLGETCHFTSRPGLRGTTYRNLKMRRDITSVSPLDPGITGTRSRKLSFSCTYTVADATGTRDVSGEDTEQSTFTDLPK